MYIYIHTAPLAWSLFDTSQEKNKSMCYPANEKLSSTKRPSVSKTKVSLPVAN